MSATHPLWMTFKSEAVERNYRKWSTMHVRTLDSAACIFACTNLIAVGFVKSLMMAIHYPIAWLAGWIALIPVMLCLFPSTSPLYLTHRELFISSFHVSALAWHVATVNGTKYLGTVLYSHILQSAFSALWWQPLNILMFQMRWYKTVGVAALYFFGDTMAVAKPLCGLFEPGDGACVSTTVKLGASMLLVVLVGLRWNEKRMRRLFLCQMERPPAARAKFWFLYHS